MVTTTKNVIGGMMRWWIIVHSLNSYKVCMELQYLHINKFLVILEILVINDFDFSKKGWK